ncbi:MAG: hypothetical protein ACOZAI_02900 [Pseudomonadota bacterium]
MIETKEKIYRHGRGGSDAEHQAHQADIKALFAGHKSLRRVTERLPNGIRACTASDDRNLAMILRRHAADMKARFAKSRAIRSWDPLFAELFEQRDNIRVELVEREDGVCAELTCDNPALLPLIHAHDAALHRFIREGTARTEESIPGFADAPGAAPSPRYGPVAHQAKRSTPPERT